MAMCLVVGNASENLSILTGIPFGHYYFTGLMGPSIFHVPILLGFAYVGMGYLSWTLGRLILGEARGPLAGSRVVTVPLAGAFLMVAWDLSMDPVWSTVMHSWIWLQGGAYFGVPVSNFLGWYLTVYVIYQLFALYLRRRAIHGYSKGHSLPSGYWRMAVLFYGISAAGNLALIPRAGISPVSDPTGAQWRVTSIVGASALVSIFVMGAFTLLAWLRLSGAGSQPARAMRQRFAPCGNTGRSAGGIGCTSVRSAQMKRPAFNKPPATTRAFGAPISKARRTP
jgi:putative membrane protein